MACVSGNSSINNIPINVCSHRVGSEVEIIDTSIRCDGAVEHEFIAGGIACNILLFTDSSHHITVHTFSTIHWRLETDHS